MPSQPHPSGIIYYFSATGNSRHIAHTVAEATGFKVQSIEPYMQGDGPITVPIDYACVGFVFPVYFWGLPYLVRDFLARLRFDGHPRYIFDIVTYGTSLGEVHRQFRLALKAAGQEVHATFQVRMVDVWTPLFNLPSLDRCRRMEERATHAAKHIAGLVLKGEKGPRHWSQFPHFIALFQTAYYPLAARTRHFRVLQERCIRCGLCARQCPARAIRQEGDELPVWTRPSCQACLRCLHHCPRFAIQYGRHTRGRGQYVFPR